MPSVQSQISNEQIALLYRQLPTSLLSSLVVACVLIIAVWRIVPDAAIYGWSAALLAVSIARFFLYFGFNKARSEARDMRQWYLFFLAGSITAGAVWGLASVLMMPEDSLGYQLLVIFILGGIMAGASLSLSATMTAYVTFCVPVVLPGSIWLCLQETPLHFTMAALFLFFLLSLVLMARYLNRALAESFRLCFENAGLVANLQEEAVVREKTEDRLHAHNNILKMLATGHTLTEVLNDINRMVEGNCPTAKSSILLLDETGKHLLEASAPSLPDAYNQAVHGVAIGPAVGSCGTAAYRNETVIVEDISTDPLWADYKELALAHGLQACWSMPIRSIQKKVMGTFALYYSKPRKPRQMEIKHLKAAANLAAIAIEHCLADARLQKMAHYDTLTGLPNRATFMDRLKQVLAQAHRRKKQFALLFIDLDKFKPINDALGHDAGDKALQETARCLQACVREVDTAARLGGDEFIIILTEIHGKQDAELVSKKVIKALCQEIELEERIFSTGCSIGISLYPANGKDADTLISKADTAMYQAKKKGNAYVFSSESGAC